MSGADYEAQYNNRARVPEHPSIIEGWARDAAAYRDAAGQRFSTVRYGSGEREVVDLFEPADPTGRTVLFIHGGYWQALDRAFFSHMARGLNGHGIAVAVPGYELCPHVRIGDIVAGLRDACRILAPRGPFVVAGHSAGGHLAACLLATDWGAAGLPAGLIPAAYAISGLFDLEPLRHTSVNGALRLTQDEAREWSPIHWRPPAGRVLDAVVGGEESAEYRRQSRDVTEAWGKAGVQTRSEDVPGANHFTVIAPLAEPGSPMTRRVAVLASAA
jgi:arylformamidase